MEYALVEREGDERLLMVAVDRLSALIPHLGHLTVLERLTGECVTSCASSSSLTFPAGKELLGTRYQHLFWKPDGSKQPTIIHSKYVTTTAGTGLVHSAPAHGKEDYEVYRSQLVDGPESEEIRCLVDDDGRINEDVMKWASIEKYGRMLVGKEVLGDAVPTMIGILKDHGDLLAEEVITHRYPCDWKTKEPIIIR